MIARAAALLLMLLGTGARAASDDASRQLQNLLYYPHAGRFRATGQFTFSVQDSGSVDNQFGVETTAKSTSYQKGAATLAYGIVDGVRAAVSEGGLIDQHLQSTNQNTGAVSGADARGLSDPTFTLTGRFLEAADDGFSADAAAAFTPPLGRARTAGNGQSANDLAGGWSASVSVPVYYRLHTDGHANEFELAPAVTRSFGSVASGTGDALSILTSSEWIGSLAFSNRFHVNDSWYVQPGLTMTMPYTNRTAPQTAGAGDTFHKTAYNAAPNFHVGFLPESWLLLDASVSYSAQGITDYPPVAAYNYNQTQQTFCELEFQATF
jgi:hypothetical protein